MRRLIFLPEKPPIPPFLKRGEGGLRSVVYNIFVPIIFILFLTGYAHAESAESQPPVSNIPEYTLEDLYKVALERSEQIKLSEEDLYIAERTKDKAKAALLPTVSAFGSYTRYTEDKLASTGSVIQPDYETSWGLQVEQSFSLSGRELTAYEVAKKKILKSSYDLSAVREEYLLSVSSAYYDVLRAKKALEIADANVERLTKHRDAAAIRLKVGEVTKTTLLRAEAELSGSQSEQIRAKNSLDLSRAVLARVAGIEGAYEIKESPESEVDSPQSFDPNFLTIGCQLTTIDCLKQMALSERIEIENLEIQKKIAEGQIKYTRGSYWPTLSIEGVYVQNDEDPSSAFFNEESMYGTIKLSFPFFEGGLRRAEVREAEAQHRQALLTYENEKKSINIEVESAYLDLMTQKGVMEKFEAQTEYAEDNYKAVSKQFEFGLANSIDVMDANTLLVTAERQLSDSRYSYQLSVLKLKRATGTLLKTVMSQIK